MYLKGARSEGTTAVVNDGKAIQTAIDSPCVASYRVRSYGSMFTLTLQPDPIASHNVSWYLPSVAIIHSEIYLWNLWHAD